MIKERRNMRIPAKSIFVVAILALVSQGPALLAGDVRIFSATQLSFTCDQTMETFKIEVKNAQPSTAATNVRVTIAFSPGFQSWTVCAGGGYSGNTCTNSDQNQFVCGAFDPATATITCTTPSLGSSSKWIYIKADRAPNAVDFYVATGAVADGSDDEPANNWQTYRFDARRQGDVYNALIPAASSDVYLAPPDSIVDLGDVVNMASVIVNGWANTNTTLRSYLDFCPNSPNAVDILDLSYLQNYVVGNVRCLPRCGTSLYPNPSIRMEEPREALGIGTTIAGDGPPLVTISDAEGTAQLSVSQQPQVLANGDNAHAITLDVRNVKGAGVPIELGALLVRISFDPSRLEFTGLQGASGFDVVAGTEAARTNREGVLRIVSLIPPAKHGTGSGVVTVPTGLFRRKGTGSTGGVTVVVEQAVSQLILSGSGTRMYRISVK